MPSTAANLKAKGFCGKRTRERASEISGSRLLDNAAVTFTRTSGLVLRSVKIEIRIFLVRESSDLLSSIWIACSCSSVFLDQSVRVFAAASILLVSRVQYPTIKKSKTINPVTKRIHLIFISPSFRPILVRDYRHCQDHRTK